MRLFVWPPALPLQWDGRVSHRGAAVLLEDGEDVLVPQPRDELQCQDDWQLLVLTQNSSRLMMSDSLDDSPASLS